jgi:anti-sigma regulatory factor (Ser/Thr protein kinase)
VKVDCDWRPSGPDEFVTSERAFPAVALSVRQARDFVTETLADCSTSLDDVRLMVSELATNAIQHALTGFLVTIRHAPTEICVALTDYGDGRPTLLPTNAAVAHGRGLALVNTLSTQWGVTGEAPPGKTVWFSRAA